MFAFLLLLTHCKMENHEPLNETTHLLNTSPSTMAAPTVLHPSNHPTTEQPPIVLHPSNDSTTKLPPIILHPASPTTQNPSNLSLIGKLVSPKIINKTAIKSIINKSWGLTNSPDIINLNLKPNTYLITFKTMEDKQIAWDSRPWSIKGYHLLLQPFNNELTLQDIDLDSTSFWVQAHHLPYQYITQKNAEIIGNALGGVEEFDPVSIWYPRIGCCIRVRVKWNIHRPLLPGFPAKSEDDLSDIMWVDLKYEKLGDFCYKCGKLGHVFKNCEFLREAEVVEYNDEDVRKLGPWMRANPRKTFMYLESEMMKSCRWSW